MPKAFHFFKRVDKHMDLLEGKEPHLEKAIKKAIRGKAKRAKIKIEPSHFHVFANIDDTKEFASSVHKEISKFDVKWDAKHYFIPLSSLSKKYVDQLIEDLHKPTLL